MCAAAHEGPDFFAGRRRVVLLMGPPRPIPQALAFGPVFREGARAQRPEAVAEPLSCRSEGFSHAMGVASAEGGMLL